MFAGPSSREGDCRQPAKRFTLCPFIGADNGIPEQYIALRIP
jgi:hypothetical protein